LVGPSGNPTRNDEIVSYPTRVSGSRIGKDQGMLRPPRTRLRTKARNETLLKKGRGPCPVDVMNKAILHGRVAAILHEMIEAILHGRVADTVRLAPGAFSSRPRSSCHRRRSRHSPDEVSI